MHSRTHETGKQSGNVLSFSPRPRLYYYPLALNLYAWNEIFLKLFCDGSPQKKPLNDGDNTTNNNSANSNNPVRNIGRSTVSRRMIVSNHSKLHPQRSEQNLETSSCSRFLRKNIFYIFSPSKKVTILLTTDDKNKIQIYHKLWLRVSVWTKYFNNLFKYLLEYERIRKDCTGRNTSVRTQLYARGRHLQRAETSRRFQELSIEAFVKKSAI